MRREVTAGQPLDLEAGLTKPRFREVDLPVLKGIFIAAAHQERELVAICLEEAAKVEPIALRLVIGHEACCRGEVEQAIVAVHRAMELTELGVRYVIAFGPHFPYSWHPFEQREGAAQASPGSLGEAAQHAYIRPTRRFAPLRALKPPSQMLQDDKRGEVEGDQRS